MFDTATYGKGKLAEAYTLSGTVKDYRRVHTYDAIGRPGKTTQTLTDGTYTSTQGYDAWGRVISQTYQRNADPAKQFDSRYHNGYLARVERGSLVLWKVNAQDAGNRPTSVALGNGLTQSRVFNPHMAQMTSGALSTAGNVARLQEGYDYDPLNNVVWRQQFWDQGGFQESFTYDALNRLETSTVQGRTAQTFRYDAAGNLLSKTGVGTGNYAYPAQGATAVRPHAVQSIPGIGGFVYDDNGNLTSGNGRTMSWTSFDMPLTITGGGVSATFVYGPEHQRIRQTRGDGSSVVYAGAQEVEKNASGTTVKTYWPGGIGVEIDRPGATVSELYWHHLDRLGSVIGLTDQQGVLKEKLGYDAWGKRRTIDGASTPNNLDGQVDNRGFTGHEMLDQLDLVHMNGRVYDPLVARFVSGDPLIQDPVDGQNYNRYSYVLNNPTNNTDPTGFECETMTGSRVCGNITAAGCVGNCNSGLFHVDKSRPHDSENKKGAGKTDAKAGGNSTAKIGFGPVTVTASSAEVRPSNEITTSSQNDIKGTPDIDRRALGTLDALSKNQEIEYAAIGIKNKSEAVTVPSSSCQNDSCGFNLRTDAEYIAHTHVKSDHEHRSVAKLITKFRELPGPGDGDAVTLMNAPSYIRTPTGVRIVLERVGGNFIYTRFTNDGTREASKAWRPEESSPTTKDIRKAQNE